jgi:gliding motility-associated-like protein
MKQSILIVALIACALSTHAQKEGNVWHFGMGAALDFNSGTAVVSSPSSMWTFEGCASIADADGNLLFYTNGGGRDPILSGQTSGLIWNREHNVMYDMGNTEGGGFSSAQSSVIVPKPGAPNQYYLFTMEEIEFNVGGDVPSQPQGRGLSYFEIDMTLNGGLGGVANYTGLAYVPSYEGLCAVRHTNGSDYWIIVHRSSANGLAVFPLTAAGLGVPTLFTLATSNAVIKASPDGKWVSTGSIGGQNLYSFDAATGVLDNQVILNVAARSAEFSPNSQRIFTLGSDDQMSYFDLTSPDINASQTPVGNVPSAGIINGQMQLAPDGKIYFVQAAFIEQSMYLSTIVCPNSSPFLELKKITFPVVDDAIFFGLPNFDNAIFRQDSDPPLFIDLGEDILLCGNETTVLNPGLSNVSYEWSTGEQTETILVAEAGTYIVTVTANGCGVGIDTIEVEQVEDLLPNAGTDTTICAGDLLLLDGMGNGTLSWIPDTLVSNANIANPIFTGESNSTLVLSATLDGCTEQDTIFITVNESPNATVSPADTIINVGESVQLFGMGLGDISWSPAAGLSCVNCLDPVASPEDSTIYVFTLTNANGCTDTAQAILRVIPPDCMPEIPNAFTPNGDGANDAFQPIGEAIESYDLTIYSRWGEVVYQGNTAWDGRVNGLEAPSDVYVYRIVIWICGEEQQPPAKEVTLLR